MVLRPNFVALALEPLAWFSVHITVCDNIENILLLKRHCIRLIHVIITALGRYAEILNRYRIFLNIDTDTDVGILKTERNKYRQVNTDNTKISVFTLSWSLKVIDFWTSR